MTPPCSHPVASTCTALISTRPKSTDALFVSTSIAASARLKPSGAVSTASTFSVLFVGANESCQHVPQFGESKPATANDPPMFGNPDACPRIVHPSAAGRLGVSADPELRGEKMEGGERKGGTHCG